MIICIGALEFKQDECFVIKISVNSQCLSSTDLGMSRVNVRSVLQKIAIIVINGRTCIYT